MTGIREQNRSNISSHAENLQTILGFYFPFMCLVSLHHTVIFKCYALKSSVRRIGVCLTFGALLALSCGFKSVSSVFIGFDSSWIIDGLHHPESPPWDSPEWTLRRRRRCFRWGTKTDLWKWKSLSLRLSGSENGCWCDYSDEEQHCGTRSALSAWLHLDSSGVHTLL